MVRVGRAAAGTAQLPHPVVPALEQRPEPRSAVGDSVLLDTATAPAQLELSYSNYDDKGLCCFGERTYSILCGTSYFAQGRL